MIASRIGRYSIQGSTDAGRAWNAEDTLLRRRVVLHILSGDKAATAEGRRNFLTEVTARYGGPDRILDAGEAENGSFYVVVPVASTRYERAHATWPFWVAAGVLLAGIGTALLWNGFPGNQPVGSVAVLPFLVIGSDRSAGAPLALGLSEELVNKLTQVSGLRVTPWVTSRRLGHSDQPLEQIRTALGVEALLTGTIGVEGGRLTGAVTLVAAEGRSIWTETFHAPLGDLFAVESAVALQVAQRIRGELSGKEIRNLAHAPGQQVDAYVTYLKGVDAWGGGRWDEARALLRKATEMDPRSAVALTALGALLNDDVFAARGGGLDQVREAASLHRRALELDPTLVRAWRGLVHIDWTIGTSRDVLEDGRAILRSGRRDAEAHLGIAESLLLGGLPIQSIERFRRVRALDPQNRAALWYLPVANVWAERYEDALRDGEAFLREFGEDPEVHWWMANAQLCLGRLALARAHAEPLVVAGKAGDTRMLFIAAVLLHTLGDPRSEALLLDALDAMEAQVRETPDHPRVNGALALLYAALGDGDGSRRAIAAETAVRHGAVAEDCLVALMDLGDLDAAITLAKELIRHGHISPNWDTVFRARAPAPLRDSPRWREVEAVYRPAHEKLLADFRDLIE